MGSLMNETLVREDLFDDGRSIEHEGDALIGQLGCSRKTSYALRLGPRPLMTTFCCPTRPSTMSPRRLDSLVEPSEMTTT